MFEWGWGASAHGCIDELMSGRAARAQGGSHVQPIHAAMRRGKFHGNPEPVPLVGSDIAAASDIELETAPVPEADAAHLSLYLLIVP